MVDRILYTSDSSNCQQDVDKFLFNFKCIALVQHNEPLHPPVPSFSKIPDTIRSLIVSFSPQTLLTLEAEEDNIIIYVVVHISRKIAKKVYSKCAAGLVGALNKANFSHLFIVAKQYQDPPTCGLVVPSSD